MKPRSDSVLFKLNNDQQAQVYDWLLTLGYQKTKNRVAQPPPEGFGIRTHLNSLRRFALRYAEILKEREFFDVLHATPDGPDPRVIQTTEKFAHHIAFDIATGPMQNLDSFRQIARWIGRLKDEEHRKAALKLAEDRLALSREKALFQLNRTFGKDKI